MTYELKPYFAQQNSFYGKAVVRYEYNCHGALVYTLISYGTPVFEVTVDSGKHYVCRLWSSWSATTGRHVNEFSMQLLGRSLFKKDWDSLWCGYTYKMTDDCKRFIDI